MQRVSDDAEPRFIMLETFREFGRERLVESGEMAATERSHAAYMLVLAEEETLEMNPSRREAWLRGCDAEHDNFRAAIAHLVSAGNVEWALRLAGALFRFWEQRDHLTEGRGTLASVLGMPGAEAAGRPRARALYAATVLADIQGDFDRGRAPQPRGMPHLPATRRRRRGGCGDDRHGVAVAAPGPARGSDGALPRDGIALGAAR